MLLPTLRPCTQITHTLVPNMRSWGVSALTLHGRTRQQRYSRQADWQYIEQCADLAPDLPVSFGVGR